MKKKFLCTFLALSMTLAPLPMSAMAAENGAVIIHDDEADEVLTGVHNEKVIIRSKKVIIRDAKLNAGMEIAPEADGGVVMVTGSSTITNIVVSAESSKVVFDSDVTADAVRVEAKNAVIEIIGTVKAATIAEGASTTVLVTVNIPEDYKGGAKKLDATITVTAKAPTTDAKTAAEGVDLQAIQKSIEENAKAVENAQKAADEQAAAESAVKEAQKEEEKAKEALETIKAENSSASGDVAEGSGEAVSGTEANAEAVAKAEEELKAASEKLEEAKKNAEEAQAAAKEAEEAKNDVVVAAPELTEIASGNIQVTVVLLGPQEEAGNTGEPAPGTDTPSAGPDTPSAGTDTPQAGMDTPAPGTDVPSTGSGAQTSDTETSSTGSGALPDSSEQAGNPEN